MKAFHGERGQMRAARQMKKRLAEQPRPGGPSCRAPKFALGWMISMLVVFGGVWSLGK